MTFVLFGVFVLGAMTVRAKQFGFSFGGDETAPWVWDAQAKRPALYWETSAR